MIPITTKTGVVATIGSTTREITLLIMERVLKMAARYTIASVNPVHGHFIQHCLRFFVHRKKPWWGRKSFLDPLRHQMTGIKPRMFMKARDSNG